MGVALSKLDPTWRKRMIAGLLRGQRPDGPNFFHGLRALAVLGRHTDSRANDARQLLIDKRRKDGTWRAGGHRYWRLKGNTTVEAVNWGDASQVVTPAALAMLQ